MLRITFFLATLILLAATAPALAGPPRPWSLPDTRAAWDEQRDEVRRTLRSILGDMPPRPETPKVEVVSREAREGYTLERLRLDNGTGDLVPAVLLLPASATSDHRVPAILYLHAYGARGKDEALRPGPDGNAPGEVLARRGYAVLCIDGPFSGERRRPKPDGGEMDLFKTHLIRGRTLWGMMLRDDQVSLDYLASRPEIDPRKLGATGFSMGSSRAWWLMALDERVACAVGVGCQTRFTELLAANDPSAHAIYQWVPGLLDHFDTEAIIALCAPRPLAMMVGGRDRTSPIDGARKLNDLAKRAWGLYDKSWEYQYTVFGGLPHAYTVLEWDMMLEFFEKHFLPQGPTPLPHPPEPEPTPDSTWTDPAEHGLAGWVAEMSQREGTWTWRGGEIECKPGPNEYGWLRAPIELDDFVLTVEWSVPKGGNSGVFVRARPVPWTYPPNPRHKDRVATLGLDWPSRTGLELQASDESGGPTKYSAGSIYRHSAPASKPTRPAGEWNRTTVRCRGPRVEVWINGEQVQDAMIDRLPTLRTPPMRGYFGLQNHGSPARFRNVRYRRLDPASVEAMR